MPRLTAAVEGSRYQTRQKPASLPMVLRLQKGERNAVDMFADLAQKLAFLAAYSVLVIVAFYAAEKVFRRS